MIIKQIKEDMEKMKAELTEQIDSLRDDQEKENEIIEEALKKVRAENHLKDDLKNGMSTVDAFKKYGIM